MSEQTPTTTDETQAPDEAAPMAPAEAAPVEPAPPPEAAAPTPPPVPAAPPTATGWGTGRRKRSIARVRLVPGDGSVTVNGRPLERHIPSLVQRVQITDPLRVSGVQSTYSVVARVHGGGPSGQAGALRLGIARALCRIDLSFRPTLKRAGLLTRDPRVKERKKYGLRKARKRPQYSKR